MRNSVGKNGHNMNTYAQALGIPASGPIHKLTSGWSGGAGRAFRLG
jgi:hypothetical protein